ncbi:MAG: rRNA maturation RNase YbeY [Alphaproteobacteria bacterium]|nr:rRNA maturation RNase YbeY [Rickettsiales bacterium]
MKIKLFRNIDHHSWHSSLALPKVNIIKKAIEKSISTACGDRFNNLSFSLSCVFMDSVKITKYNSEYRKKKQSTDVLSFPEFDFSLNKWEEWFLTSKAKCFYLGDILISYQNVIEDAKYMQWNPADRVVHLIIHSTLHLLGFDHIEEDDRIVMEGLEIDILASIGIENPFC